MGRSPYKYRIKPGGKEKRELRQAKRKGCKKARLVNPHFDHLVGGCWQDNR